MEKRKFRCLKHSIATHLLDAGADLAFVKDWLGHANIQNTTIYARLTTTGVLST
jgi:integrase/recombinase XerD